MKAAVFDGVTKRYGRQRALNDLSFSIPLGSICALVGPNGSGKTTTMGVLSGLLQAQSGSIDILGRGAFSIAEHGGRVGIMPQDSVPSPYASLVDSLTFFGELQGFSSWDAKTEANRWLGRVQLQDRANARYSSLSHGMRRRFSIAQAMLGEPEFILLDEPTSGLDPELVVEIRQLILALRGKSTLLVSSHILSELESICDYAIFLEKGHCVREDTLAQITGQDSLARFKLSKKPDLKQMRVLLPHCELNWSEPYLSVETATKAPIEETNALLLRALLDAGIGIFEITSGSSLELAYLKSRGSSRTAPSKSRK